MNKMALFVEGKTERDFNTKLILTIAGQQSVAIRVDKIEGGRHAPRTVETVTTIETGVGNNPPQHYFLVVDCGSDSQTSSRIRENYNDLVGAGYTEIICHRDLAPAYSIADVPRLESPMGLPAGVPGDPITIKFILSIMGIEAWFLAEHTHFPRIHPNITLDRITSELHFDPSVDDMASRLAPAQDMADCYWLELIEYSKSTSRTIEAIDCARICAEITGKFHHLQMLCDAIMAFLDRP